MLHQPGTRKPQSPTPLSMTEDLDPAAPLPKKRSLFKKPKWSKPAAADEAVEFFSRAKELYPMRVAEEERKRAKKLESLESIERQESTPPGSKRRRISAEAEIQEPDSFNSHPDLSRHRDSTHSTPDSRKARPISQQKQVQGSPTSLSVRYCKQLRSERENNLHAAGDVIALSDSESEGGPDVIVTKVGLSKAIDSEQPKDDLQLYDEEFPELIRRARERENQRAIERLNASNSGDGKKQSSGANTPVNIDDIFQTSSTSDPDHKIDIFVTSFIDGTKPLIVRRKISQRLKEVRLSWCDKQAMGQAMKDKVFLTWRGKRLYDVTTGKAMGLKIDLSGKPASTGGGVDNEGRVHLEAWTQELFDAHQKKMQEEEQGSLVQGCGGNEAESEVEEAVQKVRLILKSRDLEPYKLVVKPSTPIEKIVAAFRQGKGISESKNISLHFDGEQLDPGTLIKDTELGDMDTVEVHIK